MTTRHWIIAVAVAVIGLMIGGGVLLKHRRDYFLLLAQSHQKEAASSTARGEALKSRFGRTSGMSNEEIMQLYGNHDRMRDRADHHAAMARKYLRAARYPWLLVEPDPPEPE
jgi:hypothetical protein